MTIKDRINLFLPVVLVGLVLVNGIAFFVSFRRAKVFDDSVRMQADAFRIELQRVHDDVTNFVHQSSRGVSEVNVSPDSSSPASGHLKVDDASSSESPVLEVSRPYIYFTFGGRPCIKYYGRFYQLGSPMSFGRVVDIFPDVVIFDNGMRLVNTINPDQKEVVQNE